MAEQSSNSASSELAPRLAARVVGEQTLRRGLEWAASGAAPEVAALSTQQRGILASEIAMAMATRDHDNTEWLKGIVSAGGWPKLSQIGVGASSNAWLLVQHADADPAFQVRVLRLMEPLVRNGEVERQNYAYLYDRVMLRVTGKQRYASQMTCREGALVPQPLEDERNVDKLRQGMGLATLADYRQQMVGAAASCLAASSR